MSNCSHRVPDSLATDCGDDSNFQLLEKYLMFDGLQEDCQSTVTEANHSDGTRDKGPRNRESEGRKGENKKKPRFAFKTRSEVDVLDDGFTWRKYGQNFVMGSQNVRNYYRCSEKGCDVKKRVERDREDPAYLITIYEGVHNHDSYYQGSKFPQGTATNRSTVEQERGIFSEYIKPFDLNLIQFEEAGDGKGETKKTTSNIISEASDQSIQSLGCTTLGPGTAPKDILAKRMPRRMRWCRMIERQELVDMRTAGSLSYQRVVNDEPEVLDMPTNIEIEDEDEPLSVERNINIMNSKQGGEVLTEIPKGDEWLALKICSTVCKPILPESPNCPFLVALSLEGSKALMAIPSLFFEHMPALTCLNLSHTSIRSLPVSFFKLVSLKELSLRHCKLFMELSPQVGQLRDLVLLDLDETQIAELPKEIGKLSNLTILRVSLDGYMNCGMQLQPNVLIHPETIKSLSQLLELKIDVNPDNEDWNAVEEVVVEEACSLERLKCLILYLPSVQILGKRRVGNSSLSNYPLCRFRFIVGQHRQRIISRVPKKLDAHFQEWDKCLKFVKGNDISSEMKRVVGYTKAFYLERHTTARSLCDFGIKNIEKLGFCILTECNEFQTIIDDRTPYEEEQTDIVEGEVINYESKGEAFSAREPVLLNLHYLHIYYLKNLVSVWRNPTYDKQCLSNLKILELHVCPKLIVIFSPALLSNLGKLEVLVVEDCPELTSVVSPSSNASFKSTPNCFLPSLKMMLLLFLPKLENISSEFHIAPKLEKVGFYDCPELKSLSKRELSSENLKVIKGESDWWEALKWGKLEWGKEFLEPFMEPDESKLESQWRNRPVCLQNIFFPIDEDDDVMTQMEEMYKSIDPKNKNEIPNLGLGFIP